MDQYIPQEVKDIMEKFKTQGFEIYIVGGAVRDILTHKHPTDWDYTTNATPTQIQELFPDSFYDNSFGTVGIESKDPSLKPHEITTFRTEEGYSDNRRPDKVTWGTSLEEDLKRRDFTINAMAIELTDSKYNIIDPFNGKNDFNNKIIRAVGNAQDRFMEDALRMMRAIRIAAQLNFTIEENTLEAIKTNKSTITKIAKERIRDEIFKTIISPNPENGILLFKETGLMEEILPELFKAFGVDQRSPQRHHIYDVGTHLVKTLQNVKSQDPITRFAALIHDIGKPQTYKKQENNVTTFYNHEVVGSKIANRIADRLRFSNKQKDKLWKLVRWHQFTVDEYQTDSALRRFIKNVGLENIDDMLDLRHADRVGSGAKETSWRTEEFKNRLVEVQKQPFSIRDLKISGTDVMETLKIKPGPEVGKILNIIFSKVEKKEIENNKEDLIEEIKKIHLK